MNVLILNGASGTGKTTIAEALTARIDDASWIHPDALWDTPNMKPEEILKMSLKQASDKALSSLVIIDCQIRPTSVPVIFKAANVHSWSTVLHTCPASTREARLLARGWDTNGFDTVATWSEVLLEESLASGALVVDTSIQETEEICDRIIEYARETHLLQSSS